MVLIYLAVFRLSSILMLNFQVKTYISGSEIVQRIIAFPRHREELSVISAIENLSALQDALSARRDWL